MVIEEGGGRIMAGVWIERGLRVDRQMEGGGVD